MYMFVCGLLYKIIGYKYDHVVSASCCYIITNVQAKYVYKMRAPNLRARETVKLSHT